jgi:Ca2+-binding RTX toxin-like protein
MSYTFNLRLDPLETESTTYELKDAAADLGYFDIDGTNFKYDAHGFLKSGTIDGIVDNGLGGFGISEVQTVSIANLSAATLYKNIFKPLEGLMKKTSDWSTTDHTISGSANKIVLALADGTQAILTGTGLGEDPLKGHITEMEHVNAKGHVLDTIGHLDVATGLALSALGPSDYVYDYLTAGANEVTNTSFLSPYMEGGLGNDTITGGGGGFDIADYVHTATSGIHADLTTGVVTGGGGKDRLVDVIGLSGSNFNDVLTGDDGANTLIGNDGKDRLDGGGGIDTVMGGDGNDIISAGAGDDILTGGAGNDKLQGDAGTDIVDYGGAIAGKKGLTIDLSKSGPQHLGSFGNDTLKSIEGVNGSASDDHITGGKANDVIGGNGGSDVINGMGGNDILTGGVNPNVQELLLGFDGSDKLNGGAGNDHLEAGLGVDMLTGGAGKDTFYFGDTPFVDPNFNDTDKIVDFNGQDDTISFASFEFGIASGTLDESQFVEGTKAGDADDRFIYDQHTGKLWWDGDGNGTVDDKVLVAILANKADLSADNIMGV